MGVYMSNATIVLSHLLLFINRSLQEWIFLVMIRFLSFDVDDFNTNLIKFHNSVTIVFFYLYVSYKVSPAVIFLCLFVVMI
jgi:hypothetical protein